MKGSQFQDLETRGLVECRGWKHLPVPSSVQEEKRRKAKLANAFAFGNEDDDDKREQEQPRS